MLHQVRSSVESLLVQIEVGDVQLQGALAVPLQPSGVVLLAHGSGSSRHSPRNKLVARRLREETRNATLLVDLLSDEEEARDNRSGDLRFDIPLLTKRVSAVCDWLARDRRTQALPIGLFGTSTGAAATLNAAAERPGRVTAVVSRGGRPDLAGAEALGMVRAPTLFIVGGEDHVVLALNREAMRAMHAAERRLEIVPGAGHLFAEPGTLDEAAHLASAWFSRHLRR